MKISMISVGHRIKERRKELHLTQIDIYKKCGIASGALSQIENGTRTPSVIIFYKLAQALDCSMDWLLTGNSTNSENDEFSENEKNILGYYNGIPKNDQEEILMLLQLKYDRYMKKKESSHSGDSGLTEIA